MSKRKHPSTWRFKTVVVMGPERALDLPYWDVMFRWQDLFDKWAKRHSGNVEFVWSDEVGDTSLKIVPNQRMSSAEVKRITEDLRVHLEETWLQATEDVWRRVQAWKKKSTKYYTGKVPPSPRLKPKPKPGTWLGSPEEYALQFAYVGDPSWGLVPEQILVKRAPAPRWRREMAGRGGGYPQNEYLRKQGTAVLLRAILQQLSDGRPRTFSRLGAEILDLPATLDGTAFEEAMWLGVVRRELEHTAVAPILWRATAKGKRSAKAARPKPMTKKEKAHAGRAIKIDAQARAYGFYPNDGGVRP